MKKTLLTIVISVFVMSGCVSSQDSETFESDHFSFTYPSEYIADEYGLWTEERYEWHLNPPEGCSLCHVPDVRVEKALGAQTVDQYIIDAYTLGSDGTLTEMSVKVQLGDHEFTKVVVSDMLTATGYYTKKDDVIVGFVSYKSESGDWEDELEEIAS